MDKRIEAAVAAVFAILLIAGFGLRAGAESCTELEIRESVGFEGAVDAVITDRVDTPGVAVDLIYPYLNIVVGEFEGPDGWEGFAGETSFEISAPNGSAVVCPDGSVTFSEIDPMPVEVVVDIPPTPEIEVILESPAPGVFPATANRLEAMVG